MFTAKTSKAKTHSAAAEPQDTLTNYTTLSLSPDGLQRHPEIQSAYHETPHYVYTEGQWNTVGRLDYQRDVLFNGHSLKGKPLDEIGNFIALQTDGTECEPSLLARVMQTAAAGQACEAPLLTMVANQIVLTSEPAFFAEPKRLFSGKKEKEITIYGLDSHFVIPTHQNLEWKTGKGYATKQGCLIFCFAKISEGFLAIKQGDNKFSRIPEEEFTKLTKNSINPDKLPFKPLLEVHFTFQLNQGHTLGTLPAVFGLYTNVNLIIHEPSLLGFRHIYGSQEQPPRHPRHANAGFISPEPSKTDSMIPAAETMGYSGDYGDPRAAPVPFSELKGLDLDIAGSFYQLNIIKANNTADAVKIARRSTNTANIEFAQRPVVVVQGNECGPIYLPPNANNLQQELVKAIAEKESLEANLKRISELYQAFIEKSTSMQDQIGETAILGDTLRFEVLATPPTRHAELSPPQMLSAYCILFYPASRSETQALSPLNKHLREHYVTASKYAKAGYRTQLEKVHGYTLVQEVATGDRVAKYRLYQLTANRLLTEPYVDDLGENDKERTAAFSGLLLTIQHHCAKKEMTEIIIPVIFKRGEEVVSSTLISFTVHQGGLQSVASKDASSEGKRSQRLTIFLKSPVKQSSLKLFNRSNSVSAKESNEEKNLCAAIRKLFRADDCAIVRTAVYYQPEYFMFTTALLHLLILEHLDKSEVECSCKTIQAEIVPYIRRIGALPTTEFAISNEENSIPIERHEIFDGRPFKLIFQQLTAQIAALRQGIDQQKTFLQTYIEKIADIFQNMQEICKTARQPMQVAYPQVTENIRRESETLVTLRIKKRTVTQPRPKAIVAAPAQDQLHAQLSDAADDTPPMSPAEFNRPWAEALMREFEERLQQRPREMTQVTLSAGMPFNISKSTS
jgi:hypothetical protein